MGCTVPTESFHGKGDHHLYSNGYGRRFSQYVSLIVLVGLAACDSRDIKANSRADSFLRDRIEILERLQSLSESEEFTLAQYKNALLKLESGKLASPSLITAFVELVNRDRVNVVVHYYTHQTSASRLRLMAPGQEEQTVLCEVDARPWPGEPDDRAMPIKAAGFFIDRVQLPTELWDKLAHGEDKVAPIFARIVDAGGNVSNEVALCCLANPE